MGRSQALTDQVQADQKGQQGLLSTRKETHVRSKIGPVKLDMLGKWRGPELLSSRWVSPLPCCLLLCAPFVCYTFVGSAHRNATNSGALTLEVPHTCLRCV